jgi:hypothetical protein
MFTWTLQGAQESSAGAAAHAEAGRGVADSAVQALAASAPHRHAARPKERSHRETAAPEMVDYRELNIRF